ncbi:HNH endonuclease [Anabaena variabilis FACHB-164]|nr:HNH endonuclease [Trichormus variabilis FACHB-164]
MSNTPRISISLKIRDYVFPQDKYQCEICGKTTGKSNLSIYYIIPLDSGGKNEISNLQTLCFSCQHHKTDRIDHLFQRHFQL